MNFVEGRQLMIILVGLVGSGKTEFAKALSERFPTIVRCNQDELGERRHVERKAHEVLQAGQSVCIDRTNIDASQRWTWIDIGRQYPNVEVWCVLMDIPYSICRERLRRRQFHPTIKDFDTAMKVLGNFSRMYQPPNMSEGFDYIFKISPEVPRGTAIPVVAPSDRSALRAAAPLGDVPQESGAPEANIYTAGDIDTIFNRFISSSSLLSASRPPPRIPLPPKPTTPSRPSHTSSTGSMGRGNFRGGGPPRGRGGFSFNPNYPQALRSDGNWRQRDRVNPPQNPVALAGPTVPRSGD